MKTAVVTVTNTPEPREMSEKRFYVPGCVLKSTCPECGEKHERDLGDNYLNYPTANEPIEVTMCHEREDPYECHEWTVRIILRITVEPAPAA